MAPRTGAIVSTGIAASMLVAPLAFVQPSSHAAGTSLRGVQGQHAVLKETSAASGRPPMAGIVVPSLAGAAIVGAALSSLSTRTARKALPKPTGAGDAVAVAEKVAAPETIPPLPTFDASKEMGIGPAPIGFFDPLGFAKDADEQEFRKLRSAELKHGRVAMMASVGAVFQHFVKLPGFENVKGTFGAINNPAGTFGFFGIVAVSSVVELAWRERPNSRWAGDYGDPLGVNMMSDEMRNKEVNNGRMAMISVLAIWLAEVASGKDAIEQFGF
eukprot:TRINITY_DN5361_c0_g1_i1.p1 TRINITY_DN5361_c0_g1~~TRINITY_DN5361_c0_g1_i1.p1  ORF type:complete len:272 (-),score=72.44 TRINITY_DN5361_c0_g1_i1:263-1078(-)